MMARITIGALFDGDNIPNKHSPSLVASADVVVAVGVMNEESQVVYGRQLAEEIITTRSPYQLTLLEVELDMKTDQLERLRTLVRMIKGRCDESPI